MVNTEVADGLVTQGAMALTYHKTSSISRTKYQNLDVSFLVLQLSLLNPLKPGVKSKMKMLLEQRRQTQTQTQTQTWFIQRKVIQIQNISGHQYIKWTYIQWKGKVVTATALLYLPKTEGEPPPQPAATSQ